jgi:hypothetical protein
MFDINRTQALLKVLAVPSGHRDEKWTDSFFGAAWNASLEIAKPSVFQGPDRFSYMRMHIPRPGLTFDSNSIANVAQYAVEHALGIALFSSPDELEPEYILTMGVLDSLLMYDSWLGDPVDIREIAEMGGQLSGDRLEPLQAESGQTLFIGPPAGRFLPAHTARALHRHLTVAWGIPEPRVALAIYQEAAPTRNLVIGRKLSEFPSPEAADWAMSMLPWYLPPTRSLWLMPEDWSVEQMHPLSAYFSAPRSEVE